MILSKCILTHNDCYKAGRTITPKGVMVHSTGANNPNLRRYVQPDDGVLGANQSNNHWNKSGVQKCVHAFIGRTADGTVAVYQTLPWTCRGWHCGGKANNTHISFEICEDRLEDDGYFRQVYQAAAELTAYLCRKYKLDPLADGVVIDHHEGYLRGIASGHADVSHWFPRHGKSMDDFRADVARRLKEEDEDVTRHDGRVPEAAGAEGAVRLVSERPGVGGGDRPHQGRRGGEQAVQGLRDPGADGDLHAASARHELNKDSPAAVTCGGAIL